jgi:4'-phosphopantetheinyl transferase
LDADELKRAGRIPSRLDSLRFITAHGYCREILSAYLAIEPSAIEYGEGQNGKPFLMNLQTYGKIQFSLAHSTNLALVAVTLTNEVGVDLEHIRQITRMDEVVKWYFAPVEQAEWFATTKSDRILTFWRYWTLKEAYSKAKGEGLVDDLPSFGYHVGVPQTPKLLTASDHDKWVFRELMPSTSFIGALAVHTSNIQLKYWAWSETTWRQG